MLRSAITVTIASILISACGSKAVIDGPGSGGAGGSSNSGGMTTTSTVATGGTSNTGGNSAGGGGEGGSSLQCGGFEGNTCDAAFYCDYPDDFCGATDGTGTCTPRPEICDDQYDPVCACDGMIYSNSCGAAVAGFDVSNLGGCPVEAGSFACGPKICSLAGEYCLHNVSDTNRPDSYLCMPLSCMLAVPVCSCVTSETVACGGTCEVQAMGGVVVHCPGG